MCRENRGGEAEGPLCNRRVVPPTDRLTASSPLDIFTKMNTQVIMTMGLAALMATPVMAEENSLLKDINQFGGEYGDETAPVPGDALTKTLSKAHEQAYEKLGLEWIIETSYLYTAIDHPVAGAPNNQNWYLLHAQANLELIPSTGTWLRAELSLSTALDGRTWRGNAEADERGALNESLGFSGGANTDVFTRHTCALPELALMQYFASGKACVIAGVVNQTNYFDANAYANSSFSNFTNAAFVNAQVLPLADSNFGAVVQAQMSPHFYGMASFSLMESSVGYSPFFNAEGRNYNVVGEVGYVYDGGTIRLTPFLAQAYDAGEDETPGKNRRFGGVNLGFDQDLCEHLSCFGRVGWSSSDDLNACGASFAASAGLVWKTPLQLCFGLKESENNFLGLAFSVARPDEGALDEDRTPSKRELAFEVGYSYAITPYCALRPNYQFVKYPAGRSDVNSASAFGMQVVLTF